MRIRRCIKTKVSTYVLVIFMFQVLWIHTQLSGLGKSLTLPEYESESASEVYMYNYSTAIITSRQTSTIPATTTDPLLALCPDMKAHEEEPLGIRFNNEETRAILAEPWGDPGFKAKNLKGWEMELRNNVKFRQTLCEKDMTIAKLSGNGSSFCSCSNNRQKGNMDIDLSPPTWEEMAEVYSDMGVEMGGTRKPNGCVARQKVAIIIPYRNRQNHLHVFVNHLHKILVRQDMHYRIFIVEQAHPNIFNKAALMDIAFLEAYRIFKFDCVIFHDVDLLLEDDRNIYACVKGTPRHIASHTDKHNYKLPYSSLFGGGTGFTTEQFRRINGYATVYWGWGGEDDDMYARVRTLRTKLHRMPVALARFTMLKHIRDHLFPPNIYKNKLVKDKKKFAVSKTEDGLSSIKYTIHGIIERPLFTWIYAEAQSPLTEFFFREGICIVNQKHLLYSHEEVLLDCAKKCQTDAQCAMFQHQLNADWKPFCFLFRVDCKQRNSTNVTHSFIYTKGRSVKDKGRFVDNSDAFFENKLPPVENKGSKMENKPPSKENKASSAEKKVNPANNTARLVENKVIPAGSKGLPVEYNPAKNRG